MNTTKSLGGIKVKDFFGLLPWQPQPAIKQPIKVQNTDWRTLSVKEFLGQANWHGLDIATSPTLTPENPLTMKVEKFFNSMNWEGDPLSAALAELNSLAEVQILSEDNLTLSDLSDLF